MDPYQESDDLKILVIDDEAPIRESIAVYLEDSGFTVYQAPDGPTGLEMVDRHSPDVILLDLRMPEMDGLEVLAKVTERWRRIPVIVVTGAGVLKDAVEAVRLGAFDFINKPIIDMAILENAVRHAGEHRRLQMENLRYRQHLEEEIQSRTRDLQKQTLQLEKSNRHLEDEIAGHQQTAQALRRSQAQLSDVISIFEGFIYAVGKNFLLTFMNSKLLKHTGAQNPEGICHQVIYNRKTVCPWCPLEEVLTGKTLRREFQSPSDDRWYYGIFSPQIDPKNAVVGCQAIVMDVHDRKEAEIGLKLQADQLHAQNLRLRQSLQGRVRFGDIIGKSKAMHGVYQSILKAAESAANVIVYGASGTGKELVAKTIHQLSDRGDKNFIPVNCGAIPENLFESEFFGFCKGAFTGAEHDKKGFLTVADGGTLFLDEVGEIPPNMQVKLLRAVESGGYTPLGSYERIIPDIRIVAATNRNLEQLTAQGGFRKDFYYRIHVIPISLPPLCDRREDIPLLIHHFLQIFASKGERQSIPEEMMKTMQQYHWPGNVRELQNAVQQYMAMQEVDVLSKPSSHENHTPRETSPMEEGLTSNQGLSEALKVFEKQYIQRLLVENQWHRTRVASILGIDRRTLFRKIQRLKIK